MPARRSQLIRLVVVGLLSLVLICGFWLASVFQFLKSARRAGDVRYTANRIRIQELEARRAEKDFMLRSRRNSKFLVENRSEYLSRHRAEVDDLIAEIQNLKQLSGAEGKAESEEILLRVKQYNDDFQKLVEVLRERGSKERELDQLLQDATRAFEALAEKAPALQGEREFIQLCRLYTDYMLRDVPELVSEMLTGLQSLRATLRTIPALDGEALINTLERWADALREHAALGAVMGATEDTGLQMELRQAIHFVEPAIESILARAVAADETANGNLLSALLLACGIMALLLTAALLFGQTSRMRLQQVLSLNNQLEHDVTERKRMLLVLEEQHGQLLQAERLAAIGQMVTGLAHESRNALQRSQACLDMLSHRVRDVPRAPELVARIQEAQNHLQHLYEDVREYAAPVQIDRKACSADAIVEAAWDSLALLRQTRGGRLLQRSNGPGLHCELDAFAIEQVFRNIFENSLEACDSPVEITVDWSHPELNGRPHLRASVRDNGPGLTPEQRGRIFDPFFTTKTKGTGLGMAIAKRLVAAHQGRIEVGEAGTPGAEIIITLPVNGESA